MAELCRQQPSAGCVILTMMGLWGIDRDVVNPPSDGDGGDEWLPKVQIDVSRMPASQRKAYSAALERPQMTLTPQLQVPPPCVTHVILASPCTLNWVCVRAVQFIERYHKRTTQ